MKHTESPTRCQFTFADGRRCTMPHTQGHTLCGSHLRAQQRRMRGEPGTPVNDLLDGIPDLRSPAAVNHLLANLSIHLMDGRIDPRTAVVLAYLCQLLLQTISMSRQERWPEQAAGFVLPEIPAAAASALLEPL